MTSSKNNPKINKKQKIEVAEKRKNKTLKLSNDQRERKLFWKNLEQLTFLRHYNKPKGKKKYVSCPKKKCAKRVKSSNPF